MAEDAVPVMHGNMRIYLPGRSVDELIGPVEERKQKPHNCRGNHCPDASHKRRTFSEDGIFLTDGRPNSPYQCHHDKGGIWVGYWCRKPHEDLLEAWRRHMGALDDPTYGLSSFEIIRWPNGKDLLLAIARDSIFSLWLTIEEPK